MTVRVHVCVRAARVCACVFISSGLAEIGVASNDDTRDTSDAKKIEWRGGERERMGTQIVI